MTENVRLWTVLFVAPAVWATHLQVSYSLHATACESESRLMLWIVSLVSLAVLAANAWFALVLWRAHPEPHPGGSAGAAEHEEPRWRGRARFMAAAAFAGSWFFALIVTGQTLPMILLRPCD